MAYAFSRGNRGGPCLSYCELLCYILPNRIHLCFQRINWLWVNEFSDDELFVGDSLTRVAGGCCGCVGLGVCKLLTGGFFVTWYSKEGYQTKASVGNRHSIALNLCRLWVNERDGWPWPTPWRMPQQPHRQLQQMMVSLISSPQAPVLPVPS